MPSLDPHDLFGKQLRRISNIVDVYFFINHYGWSKDAEELFGGDPGRRYSIRVWTMESKEMLAKRKCDLTFNWLMRIERWLEREFASYDTQYGVEINNDYTRLSRGLQDPPMYRIRKYEYAEGDFHEDFNWRFLWSGVNHPLDQYFNFGNFRYDFALNAADSAMLKLYGVWPVKGEHWPKDWPTSCSP